MTNSNRTRSRRNALVLAPLLVLPLLLLLPFAGEDPNAPPVSSHPSTPETMEAAATSAPPPPSPSSFWKQEAPAPETTAPKQKTQPQDDDDSDLPRKGRIRGRVLGPDGHPVAGVTVQWEMGCLADQRKTGPDGTFHFEKDVPINWHQLKAFAPRQGLLDGFAYLRIPREGALVDAEIRLERACTLTAKFDRTLAWGVVHCRRSWRAAQVTPGVPPREDSPGIEWSELDGGLSEVEIEHLRAGEYEITLRGYDDQGRWVWAREQVTLRADQPNTKVLAIRPAASIRGRVTDPQGRGIEVPIELVPAEGNPWAGRVPTQLFEDDVSSNAQGEFTIPWGLPGRWVLRAPVPEDQEGWHRAETLVLVKGSEPVEADLALGLERTATVRAPIDLQGYILSVEGHQAVTLRATGPSTVQIGGLRASDRIRVVAQESDGFIATRGGRRFQADVRPDAEALLVETPAARIRGRVVGPDGRPAGAGVHVVLTFRKPYPSRVYEEMEVMLEDGDAFRDDESTGHTSSTSSQTDAQGRFEFDELSAGPYRLSVPGLPDRELTLKAGEQRAQTVRLPR